MDTNCRLCCGEVVGLLCQGIGGVVWAMCIALICAILTTSDPGTTRFRNMMDEVNHLMSVSLCLRALRIELHL